VKGGKPDGRITRQEMIDRAQDWVNRRIPYSQSATTDGYRQDCSGMVSMAWKSSTSGGGHTTYNMQDICTRIDRSQMQAGDAILRPDEHVLLFHYWVDNDRFYEYAEHDYGTVASHDVTSYSYWANQGFFPCRYKYVA
jgi:cell wall-associated NlpC family hydrolase